VPTARRLGRIDYCPHADAAEIMDAAVGRRLRTITAAV